jgi:hypothetical protein
VVFFLPNKAKNGKKEHYLGGIRGGLKKKIPSPPIKDVSH